jgi:methylated-DNA-protein-cysteine methyltransferase related protein
MMVKQNFSQNVYKVVRMIPSGMVASYGQVALYVGVPRAARQVGWALSQLKGDDPVPWWRVVNNKGRISIKASTYSAEEQRQLLIQEGLSINKNFGFNIEKYRFRPGLEFFKNLSIDPIYLNFILRKIPLSDRTP